jgi:hypothetical protein
MAFEAFKLEPQDRTNPLWIRLEAHLQQALAEQRLMNDSTQTMERTENIRGRIAQIKLLLNAGQAPIKQT